MGKFRNFFMVKICRNLLHLPMAIDDLLETPGHNPAASHEADCRQKLSNLSQFVSCLSRHSSQFETHYISPEYGYFDCVA